MSAVLFDEVRLNPEACEFEFQAEASIPPKSDRSDEVRTLTSTVTTFRVECPQSSQTLYDDPEACGVLF